MSASSTPLADALAKGRRRSRGMRGAIDRWFVIVCVTAASMSIVLLVVLLTAIIGQASVRNAAVVDAVKTPVPQSFADWGEVNWSGLAMHPRHEFDMFDPLANVDWAALAKKQKLESAADIAKVDWGEVTYLPDTVGKIRRSDRRDLEKLDWASVMEVIGKSGFSAWSDGYAADVFLTGSPSRNPAKAGLYPSMIGTICICAVCAFTAIPLGVGTAVLLEEFRPRHKSALMARSFIQLNITNLAGVPSVVYGILGLTAFVSAFHIFDHDTVWEFGTKDDFYYIRFPFGRGVITGGLTLMLVVLPIVIVASQEALRSVPDSLRQGSLALGATRWQTIWNMSLPAAIPGIMTGSILAMSRAIGEAAPILIIAGIVYITFTPDHLMDDFTAMPLQIYDWAGRPQQEFHNVAAAGIVILLSILLSFNALAVFIRQKFQKQLS